MNNSFLIWIPSIQNFIRFNELTVDQLRCILKIINENDLEFVYLLNRIIKENIIDYPDYMSLTTIDRFVIFTFLKIHSCSTSISMTKKCDKCKISTNIKIDLNQLIDNIAPKIDKQFQSLIQFKDFTVICDIPTMAEEYKIYYDNKINNIDRKDVYHRLNEYLLSNIKKVSIGGNIFDLADYSYVEQTTIFNKLPSGLIINIQDQFLNPIHNDISDINFVNIECKCGEKFNLNFDVKNINDIIKLIYKDYDFKSLLISLYNIQHMNTEFLTRISPMELEILNKLSDNTQPEASNEELTPAQSSILDIYRQESKGMQESDSEF